MNTLNQIKALLRCERQYHDTPVLYNEASRLLRMAEKHDNSNITLREAIEERKLENPSSLPSKYSIAVHIWGRDCDQMEASYVQIMPATVQHYLKAEREMYDNAEGPCSMHIMTEQEYIKFEPYRRDHRAEQYNY